jgi:hypothetical protein
MKYLCQAIHGETRFCPVPHIVQSVYKWYVPNNWCLSTSFCWWYLYNVTDCKEGYVLRKLQWGLSATERCERWNIKINEDSGHLLSHRHRSSEAHLILNGQNSRFISQVKYPVQISIRGLYGDCTQRWVKPRPSEHLESTPYSDSWYSDWPWAEWLSGQSLNLSKGKNFLYSTSSKPALRPTHLPIQRV